MTAFATRRDPLASLLQSAALSLARRGGAGHDHPLHRAATALVTAETPDPTAAYAGTGAGVGNAATCAGLGLDLLRAVVANDAAARGTLLDRIRFSACDPLWAATLLDYADRFLPGGVAQPIPYRRYATLDDFVIDWPRRRVRVALVSDWGTGTAEAACVAALIARQLPDIVIHLGDIYYAGTSEECDAHFLAPLRAALGTGPRLFSLCGNHDVYSGGAGYYGLLGEIGQPASYFCLRAADRSWQFLAADTGLHDRDPFDVTTALTSLDPDEERWHADKLRGFPGRTIFLTHHQPFSAFSQIGPAARHDPTNPNLMATHGRLAAAGAIDAWFWGHEHALRLYAPYRGVGCGRNIGYGAVPVEAARLASAPLAGLDDPPLLAADLRLDVVAGANTHGFATLDLAPARIDAAYWEITRPDAPIYRETIPRADPAPGAAIA